MKTLQSRDGLRLAKIWVDELSEVDSQTLDQIMMMLDFPYLFKHLAVMPDCHLGRGAVVGAVMACENTVVPNVVGVDIGCGVCAMNTGVRYEREKYSRDFWLDWKTRVSRAVPVGFSSHRQPQEMDALERSLREPSLQRFVANKAPFQLGTLGGGNHFMEAQYDENEEIWLMVHSGSRHTGLEIANFYNGVAKSLNERWQSNTPRNLWFLRADDDYGRGYLHDMQWAVDYALENRWLMLKVMAEALHRSLAQFPELDVPWDVRRESLNIHHNFVNLEHHFDRDVYVHRKGATQAMAGQLGIVPGSMGAPTYIVEGLGNPESFMSCSHGAGRRMSRGEAKRRFDTNALHRSLAGTFTKASSHLIDEAPEAYKEIATVMAEQSDLVKIRHELHPIITVKGEGD